MNNVQGHKELVFQLTINVARKMLIDDLITPEEYCDFETIMTEKYTPIISPLFIDVSI